MNILSFHFRCHECNGYPQARIKLNNSLVKDHAFASSEETIEVTLPNEPGNHQITVERYGKLKHNMIFVNGQILQDQILEIISVMVDGVPVPINLVEQHCKFEWDSTVHAGSRYFGPNGTWTYSFATPYITHLLDLRIQHESQYNQDYHFPWSNRLGPDSVQEITAMVDQVTQRVQQVL